MGTKCAPDSGPPAPGKECRTTALCTVVEKKDGILGKEELKRQGGRKSGGKKKVMRKTHKRL